MSWKQAGIQPWLPVHCQPQDDFLLRFSSTFHVCTPTYLAFASTLLGILSITAWLFAQLPQIWKNFNLKSTSGLSIFFLAEWCLGDLGNLLGAIFTKQATWQVTIGIYYVFVDLCLVLQWFWYEKLKHGRHLYKIKTVPDSDTEGSGGPAAGSQAQSSAETEPNARPRPIFRTPTFKSSTEKQATEVAETPKGTKVYRTGPSSSFVSPSPRTMILVACLVAMANASPLTTSLVRSMQHDEHDQEDVHVLATIGAVLSWMSTVLYLGSRMPQIIKNWQRKSTAGLSPYLFIAAFCGNLFYSAAIATNPCAWFDFESHGGGGWVGSEGSKQSEWISAALPFFLGAAGVLILDATVGYQFLLYGKANVSLVVVDDEENDKKSKWRRVSGWMRGWIPSISETRDDESRRLLEHNEQHGEGYGALH